MPLIDARTGEIVLRIVYDGAPEAGKTTNVHRLGERISIERRGAAASPGTRGSRTEFFDWLDFAGGYLDGRRVRCQLVSVPGQASLLHRRRYLLRAADAIVFVADSRPGAFAEARAGLETTLRLVERLADEAVGLVLQANKQDLSGALAPAEVAAALGVDPSVAVVGTVASTGDGVVQALSLAVALATRRVRALLAEGKLPDSAAAGQGPDALHALLLEREPVGVPAPARLDDAGPECEMVVVELEIRERGPTEAAPDAPPPGRRNRLARLDDVALPGAHELVPGYVWPPLRGRGSFAIATSGRLEVTRSLQPWAPVDALEISSDQGFFLHSSERWCFASDVEARLRLFALARELAALGTLVPPGRALAVARDGDAWRLWLATPALPPLVSELRRGAPGAARLSAQVLDALARVRAAWAGDRIVAGGPGALAVQGGDTVHVLALGEVPAAPGCSVDALSGSVRERLASLDGPAPGAPALARNEQGGT